jgi:hypothetical protein
MAASAHAYVRGSTTRLLKADVSDAGEGWSDSQIAAALATSVDTVARTRQRLVEEGLDGALTRPTGCGFPTSPSCASTNDRARI